MSGENELRPSSWTVDTLKDHLQNQHDGLVKMLDERAANQTKAIDAALAAADKLVQTALVSAEKAVDKANDANEKRFECVSADTPVLCADLVWRPAGDLLVGDELIGLDEDSPTRRGRRFRRSFVTANSVERDALLLVTTSVGAVRCNAQHPWLARRTKDGTWAWVRADELRPDDQLAHPMDPWITDRSWESGWLAGMFDGEGCLSTGKGRVQLTISQRESPTSDMIMSVLKEKLGQSPLAYRKEPGTRSTPRNTQPFFHFMIANRPDALRVLGQCRPPRLLTKADAAWEGAVLSGWGRVAIVQSVEPAGSGLIAALSTSTHTYIAGGFAMHNSVNEFRAQLTDQATTFARREEIEVRFKALTDRIDADALRSSERLATLESRIDTGKGIREGAATSATTTRMNSQLIIAGIGLLLIIVSVSVAVIVAFKK